MKKIIGTNFLIDIYNVDEQFLKRKFLLDLIKALTKITKSKPVGKPIVKKIFSPEHFFPGYSILQIIQESHIIFHTWLEYNYLAIDIFSYKGIQSREIINFLEKKLNKRIKIKIKEYKRVAIVLIK